ncbi:MAG: hypothetical protein O2816_18630 [Planctomycetota bacterium]|nr:hypothetical protein [Planctomycetota bacterium]
MGHGRRGASGGRGPSWNPGGPRPRRGAGRRRVLRDARSRASDWTPGGRDVCSPRSRCGCRRPPFGNSDLGAAPDQPEEPQLDPSEQTFHGARDETVDAFERRYIQALLKRTHGRVRDAARIAGLNPRSLYEKMKKHGIQKEFFRT